MSSEDSPYVELDVYSVHLHAQSFDSADAVSKAYVENIKKFQFLQKS